ncbi:agmatinase [Priestia megaterium]|uniref:agmatinase n=1 Tax=Priestia megaterium TaxID=1404 RepID=UPI000BFB3103|nr:agmatinase [Priestia megaterium]PGK20690.1 agmatinase [Priestia megaterium]
MSKGKFLAYAGTPSFWRCEQTRELKNVDIAVMGIPFDVGTSNRPGARFGPRTIRDMSLHAGNFTYPWTYDVKEKYNIIDYGDVGLGVHKNITDFMIQDAYEHAKTILNSGAKLLTLGGDHTIPYGMVRAAKEKYGQLSLLHFDSHQDSLESGGEEIFHGSFAHDLAEEGAIDAKKSAQVYIRTEMPNECNYNIIDANQALEMKPAELAEHIKSIVGNQPVYLTFDIDCLDPAYAPGTGTPVVGGPSTHQIRSVLQHLKGLNIVAADLVEVAPMYDPTNVTPLAAATIAGDLIYLLAENIDNE